MGERLRGHAASGGKLLRPHAPVYWLRVSRAKGRGAEILHSHLQLMFSKRPFLGSYCVLSEIKPGLKHMGHVSHQY